MINRLDAMARHWASADRAMSGSLQKLNSGQRIVSAADDAAGLSIAERLRSQSTGSVRAQRNVMDGISLAQSADAVLGEIQGMLHRARELAVAYHHGTMSASDRTALQSEADALAAEADRLVAGATFNGVAFLAGGSLSVHVGTGDPDSVWTGLPNVAELLDQDAFYVSGNGTTIVVTVPSSGGGGNGNGNGNGNGGVGNGNGNGNGRPSRGGGGGGGTVLATTPGTETPIARIDQAIDALSMYRGIFGAFQNRLEHALGSLASSHESLLSAESRIRDADMAVEVTALARNRIRSQATAALAAQGHVRARDVVKLLTV
jgi:flagellin